MTQTVLITGANRGIGLALAQVYAAQGWQVIATCRVPDRAADLQALAAQNDRVEILPLDTTIDASVAQLAGQLQGRAIDLLINNAGTRGAGAYGQGHGEQSLGTHDFTEWQSVLNINAVGPLRVTQALLPNISAVQGIVANIGSTGGSIAVAGQRVGNLAYQASKAALNMITRVTAEEAKQDKVTVVSICPGKTRTQDWHTEADYPVSAVATAENLMHIINGLTFSDSGRFMDKTGNDVAW